MEVNQIICGDCLEVMKDWPDKSMPTIITDPPYGLKFMGKKWDYDVPGVEVWRECLRVMKPGGTLLCFAGSRTQHRMAVNIEDAGFILKDCIMWLYGSGFPKATDISKQLDKGKREVIGKIKCPGMAKTNVEQGAQSRSMYEFDKTSDVPVSPEALLWNGWKSHGLKPAYEPILVAMKPNDGTYANNALKWGVSGLNIDGARIEYQNKDDWDNTLKSNSGNIAGGTFKCSSTKLRKEEVITPSGRFPANIILDEESGRLLDLQSGESKGNNSVRKNKNLTGNGLTHGKMEPVDSFGFADSGGASRFFYCAKASKAERNRGCEGLEIRTRKVMGNMDGGTPGQPNEYTGTVSKNHHPTVKPLALMEYLCKLTMTPTGGLVLDPFIGSGTTAIACIKLGIDFIGIEKEPEYAEIARAKVKEQRAGQKGLWE